MTSRRPEGRSLWGGAVALARCELVKQHERRPLAIWFAAVGPPVTLARDVALDRYVVIRHRVSGSVGRPLRQTRLRTRSPVDGLNARPCRCRSGTPDPAADRSCRCERGDHKCRRTCSTPRPSDSTASRVTSVTTARPAGALSSKGGLIHTDVPSSSGINRWSPGHQGRGKWS
jgi:hypothetical protein